ncbi:MAG: ABC transporter permease, partial [Myxococcaceae bacterium]
MIAATGKAVRDGVGSFGALAMVAARTIAALGRMNRAEFLRELVHFGHGTIPLAVGTATLTGATVVLQTRLYVEHFGARGFMGWAAGYAVLWELGPLLLGLLLAARVGARNAAELAV